MERPQLVERAGDERRRHEPRKIEHEQFLGRIADRTRVVDDKRVAGDPLEQISGGDVADVERRVLAHQDGVDVGREVERHRVAGGEVIAFFAPDGDRASEGADVPVFVTQRLGGVMEHAVPASLSGEHERKARIAGNGDRFHGVHLDGDSEAHAVSA